jgi:hypothetical protein
MHGLIALILEVIAPAIILLVVVLMAPQILVVASRAFVASIVLMAIIELLIIVVALVASMVVAIFMTVMLTVAQFTATCNRKLIRFLFLWLLVLGDLLKIASRLAGHLTLLKEGNHL